MKRHPSEVAVPNPHGAEFRKHLTADILHISIAMWFSWSTDAAVRGLYLAGDWRGAGQATSDPRSRRWASASPPGVVSAEGMLFGRSSSES
jgi:hypothetical protein